ncbi:MAG TPA: S41 family peptidase [Blastocatellia bacterium]|nr:S41 family peptidase [Blastocatellia bacterium]
MLLASAAAGSSARSIGAFQTTAVSGAAASGSLSLKDRVEVFEGVWKTVNERYYEASLNGVDWRAVRERYRPLVEQASGDDEFYRFLKQMVGELHDAHTRFHTPEERRERERDQTVSIGLSIFEVEGKPVVTDVEPDSDAAHAGVEQGMVVLEIEDRPVSERLAEARARVAGSSSDRAVRLRIYRMIIDGDPGTTVRLRLAGADDRSLAVTLTRRIVRDAAVVTSRRLRSRIGHIRLTLWKSPVRKQFKKALKEFRDAPGLIIDIRGNPGGEAEEVVKIASYFFNSHVPFGKFSNRSGRAVYLRTDEDEEVYKGPVAILVNEGSGSGSELFAGVMQETGRAIVIGRQSCGCVRGISKFRKFGEGELAVSEFGYLSPGGKTYEGVGVTPDKIVELRISDLQQHRDVALEEAERLLRTKTSMNVRALPLRPPGLFAY